MKAYKRVCVDLFSGLGGFSQAFLDRGWTVYRYDNDKQFSKVPCTHLVDVLDLTAEIIKGKHKEIDIILASPPCRCFSVAADHYHWPKGIPTEETRGQIRLVKHSIGIIEAIKPRYWILENPAGRMRNVLGKPAMRTYWCAWGTRYKKPTDLWGCLPPVAWKMAHKWVSNPTGGAGNLAKGDPYPRDLAKRSMVPYEFSLAVCLAVEGLSTQETLE